MDTGCLPLSYFFYLLLLLSALSHQPYMMKNRRTVSGGGGAGGGGRIKFQPPCLSKFLPRETANPEIIEIPNRYCLNIHSADRQSSHHRHLQRHINLCNQVLMPAYLIINERRSKEQLMLPSHPSYDIIPWFQLSKNVILYFIPNVQFLLPGP